MYVRNMKPNLKKLEDKGQKIFIGYERGSKAYKAYDPLTGHVTITRDVVFDKSGQWSWSGGDEGSGDDHDNHNDMFTVQYEVLHSEEEDDELAADPGTPPASVASPGTCFLESTPRC
jgi:hypothetical protein